MWVIVTSKRLRLSVTCKQGNNLESSWVDVKSPFDIVSIPTGCTATNDYLTLTATFDYGTTIPVKDDFVNIMTKTINMSVLTMWKDYNDKLIDYEPIDIPKTLPSLNYIPMDSLINEISLAKENQSKRYMNVISFVVFGVVALILIVFIILYAYCKCKRKKFKITRFITFGKRSGAKGDPGKGLMAGAVASAPEGENFTETVGPSPNKKLLNYIALYPQAADTL